MFADNSAQVCGLDSAFSAETSARVVWENDKLRTDSNVGCLVQLKSHHTITKGLIYSVAAGTGDEMGHPPRAALYRGRQLEWQKMEF